MRIPVRPVVFALPLGLFLLMVVSSLVDIDATRDMTTRAHVWILEMFSDVYAFAGFGFVLTCLWAFFSPLGKIRIGGAEATPILSRWNWFGVTLTTTIAIGILFWATAEPMFHLYQPGGLPITPGSEDAARFEMTSLFMHWSVTPYAIYAVPGLTFALVYHNLGRRFSISAPLQLLFGRRIADGAAQTIDAICVLSLLFGLSATLGAGILSISGGIGRLTGLATGPLLTAGVGLTIVAAFFVSSASGLQRGIRILSDVNTRAFLILAPFVLLAGPTLDMLRLGLEGLFGFGREFVARSLILAPFNDREWVNDWTVFNWAAWLAWAPLSAMFLGRIARGYTVREFIIVNLVAPALFSIVWMTIFGGLALHTEMATPGVLKNALEQSGPESVLYTVVDSLPFSFAVTLFLVLLSFLSYVTAADSNTDVLAGMTLRSRPEQTLLEHSIIIKLIWALVVGLSAWVMITYSGIDGIRILSNLGGFPALFIVLMFNITLILLGTLKLGELRETNPATQMYSDR